MITKVQNRAILINEMTQTSIDNRLSFGFKASSSPDIRGAYPVHVSIEDFIGLDNRLAVGMQGAATVVIEEKPIIQFLLLQSFRSDA